ncbi:RING-type E3 ubiquitin-protein ligase PPIL2 [Planococcus citri]|uniref:RING-type E3 ubiquitin-protein ligase PPIL2 n=1 Tax=Planococcus citri TaxID=170843 RepID=UPI0031F97FE5
MGKRQHQKDKMYLTYTEWTTLYGGKKEGVDKGNFRRLPFDHCCVSLQPFVKACCDQDGNIFDLQAIIGYLKKYKHNPVNGKPLDLKKLVNLNFVKNEKGEYHCPVLYKVFTNQSHMVANSKSGNVFSYEAVEQLNIKTKSFKDLITDEPFQRSDLIILQDPTDLSKFNIMSFHHVKNNFRVETEEELEFRAEGNMGILKTVANETKVILNELERDYKPAEAEKQADKPKLDKFNAAHYSTGKVAAGFTSTAMDPVTLHEAAVIDEDVVRYERVKKKGYVRLVTNFGPLNIQLDSDIVPKTCENFLKLCQRGYYENTKFHRSIRNFMIQGGDPTGTGTGGESIWKKPFEDEFKPNLTHSGRGILSMANSGTNTNKSQFFITFRSCRHLDNKHTVFGKIVGGMDTLNMIEQVEVDNKDRPIEDIIILKTQVFVDPYQEVDDQLAADRAAEIEKQTAEENKKTGVAVGASTKVFKRGIGKYINPEVATSKTREEATEPVATTPLRKKKKGNYGIGSLNVW